MHNKIEELSFEQIDFVGGADVPEAYSDGQDTGRKLGQAIEDGVEYVAGFIAGVFDAFTNGE